MSSALAQHWRQGCRRSRICRRLHGDNPVVTDLFAQLPEPDLDSVLPRLELEAIPRPTNKAAVHLAAIVETIHNCEHSRRPPAAG